MRSSSLLVMLDHRVYKLQAHSMPSYTHTHTHTFSSALVLNFTPCSMPFAHQSNLPVLDSSSPSPNLFDGTTRLYISFLSPFAQRAWCARNFKGLDQIEVIAINLGDKPSWYAEKVYPIGKVPALEHNGKVIGESLDILEYIDQNFEGPALYPEDPAKKDAFKELLTFSESFMKSAFALGRNKEATKSDVEATFGPLLDQLEEALGKFEDDGPYFTGEIGAVDLAYAPLIERIELLLQDLFNYDIYTGRPRLLKWYQAMNTVDAFTSTKCEPQALVQILKKFMGR